MFTEPTSFVVRTLSASAPRGRVAAASSDVTPPGCLSTAVDDAERRHAVETGLLSLFLRGSQFRQRVGVALMFVFGGFCHGEADNVLLLLWVTAGLSILALRNRLEKGYEQSPGVHDALARDAFLRRMTPIYATQGAVWGVSLSFFFVPHMPLYDQIGCWLVLACVASAPLTTVSLVPRLLKAYTNTLFFVLIVTMLTLTALRHPVVDQPGYLLLGLPFFYWWLLGHFGRGIFQNQNEQFGLQYDIARKEQEARSAVETKDRFLAAAAHDMRQPVMALSLYAEHLVEYPDMHLELAPKIAAASQAVKSMFESLFDLANLDSGKVVLDIKPVNIAGLLKSLHVQFEPLAAERNIELRLHLVDAAVTTDVVRMQRMLGNVLGNAIKYSPPGRKILLAARVHGDRVRVEVWDQGFGIPASDIDKVFQEFYRVDRPEAPAIDGVGLGLSIVSRLSRVLGTRIEVRSVVGAGTCFVFHLSDIGQHGRRSTASLDVG